MKNLNVVISIVVYQTPFALHFLFFIFIEYWEFDGRKSNSTWKRKTANKLTVWNLLIFTGHYTPTTPKSHVWCCKKKCKHMRKDPWTKGGWLGGPFELGRTVTFWMSIQTGNLPSPSALADFTIQIENHQSPHHVRLIPTSGSSVSSNSNWYAWR
jgi:hypothetical protein